MRYLGVAVILSMVLGLVYYKQSMLKPELTMNGPEFATDYDADTIVPEHDSVCSYCENSETRYKRRFGLFNRWHDQLDGTYAHSHKCSECGEEYVCGFQCTLTDSARVRIEKGLKSRE